MDNVLNSLNNQYEEDYKLEKTFLDHIQFFDPKLGRYVEARLVLFGHSYRFDRFNSYDCNFKIPERHGSFPRDIRFEYDIVEENIKEVTVRLPNGILIRLHRSSFKTFKEYYGELNGDFASFQKKILNLLSTLQDDAELIQVAHAFIEDTSPIFFTDECYIWGIEKTLEMRDKFGRLLLMWRDYKDYYAAHSPRGFESYILSEETKQAVKSYIEESFFLFAKLIQERLKIQEGEAVYLTYVFLNRVVIRYFSKKWEDECGWYFHNINEINLKQAVDQFCTSEANSKRDPISAGIFVCYLIEHNKFEENNYLICLRIFQDQLQQTLGEQKYKNFIKRVSRFSRDSSNTLSCSITDVDLMTGLEFEKFVSLLFQKMGYETEITKTTGDQGIDIIASKNGNKLGIQAKCYSGSVGNSAVQEAVAGRGLYGVDKVIVVTNRFFTKSAKELAMANSVVLWDRDMLKAKIAELL